MKESGYNRPQKNLIRKWVSQFFKDNMLKHTQLLTLETSDWLFHKAMGYQSMKVYQISDEEFDKMQKNKPKGVILKKGDINFSVINSQKKYKGAYFDYCNTFRSNRKYILDMLKLGRFESGSPIAFTFSTRDPTNKNQRQHIQKTLKPYLNHIYSFPYKDGCGMITMLFKVK
jgi:hypothetical protein